MPRKTDDKEKEPLEIPLDVEPAEPLVEVPADDLHTFRQSLIDIGMDFSERLKKRQGITENDISQLNSLRVLYDTLACHSPIE
jgi:hypothetical protein